MKPFSQAVLDRFGVRGFSQFTGAEMIAKKYGYCRDRLDEYALESHRRAAAATERGDFDAEIVPLQIEGGHHTIDEGIRFDASLEGRGSLKTLVEGGAITAGNASQICDGSSAVLVVSERALKVLGLFLFARFLFLLVSGG